MSTRWVAFPVAFIITAGCIEILAAHLTRKHFNVRWYGRGTA